MTMKAVRFLALLVPVSGECDENTPVKAVVVLDASNSMTDAQWKNEQAIANEILKQVSTRTKELHWGVMRFSHDPVVVKSMRSTPLEEVNVPMEDLERTSTEYLNALPKARNMLLNTNVKDSKQLMFFLTDGNPTDRKLNPVKKDSVYEERLYKALDFKNKYSDIIIASALVLLKKEDNVDKQKRRLQMLAPCGESGKKCVPVQQVVIKEDILTAQEVKKIVKNLFEDLFSKNLCPSPDTPLQPEDPDTPMEPENPGIPLEPEDPETDIGLIVGIVAAVIAGLLCCCCFWWFWSSHVNVQEAEDTKMTQKYLSKKPEHLSKVPPHRKPVKRIS